MDIKDCNEESKQLMIIDTDCGIDDALALILALSYPQQWKILAVTCCYGNTTVDNVCQNVLKILFANEETSIPVYCGCKQPLVLKHSAKGTFGEDGFGNVSHEFPTGDLKVSDGHAVNALVTLAKEYPNQVTLVALGPLTNIAMAHRMDSEFTSNLRSLVVMGGNYHGIGNITNAAEFNFYCDPESAHVVFSEADCSLWLVPWEPTVDHGMRMKQYCKCIDEKWKIGKLAEKITVPLLRSAIKVSNVNPLDPDFVAMAAVVCPQCVIQTIEHPVSVEVSGTYSRGLAVIERRKFSDKIEMMRNVTIVTKFDDDILNKLRIRVLSQ